ncbi:MAG: ABC-F family ATP-binding cassette domain-containing protein [Myxococcota bacterium]
MAVLLASDVHKSFGPRRILKGVDLRVDAGEHIGLVGVNGGGKSTLLKMLTGRMESDHGTVHVKGRMALLDQDPHFEGERVADVMRQSVAWHTALRENYERLVADGRLEEAEPLQSQLDTVGWEIDHRIDAVLDRVRAPTQDRAVAPLSGGERRRVALASVLLQQPDILLLDEPTNHLDPDVAEWLESWIAGFRGAVVLVTHDRYLLEASAERIVEIDQGVAVSYQGSYGDYLVQRAERHARLEQARERQLSLIAREAAWAARSPSARTTKQKARLDRLDNLKASVPVLAKRSYSFAFETGVAKGSTLLEVHGLTKAFPDKPLFADLDFTVRPGDRWAILGPNGAGKSTLLKVLLGLETPDRGEVLRSGRLKVGLLDQARSGLVDDDTVLWAAGDGREHLDIGEQTIHVASFLERFAFDRSMFEQKVAALSGGERARLLLARLMLSGANLLVLDEPTNDLDLLTLRTLEEALLGFDGGVLVVTHDRAFVDRVATEVLGFEGEGHVQIYADRSQLVTAQRARLARAAEAAQATSQPVLTEALPSRPRTESKRLSFKEQKELESLPRQIEDTESQIEALESRLSDPATYRDHADEVGAWTSRLEELQGELEGHYARWEELEARAS